MMAENSVYKRLRPSDLTIEFRDIVRYMDEGITPVQYCGLDGHFAAAREKSPAFCSHGQVLAISIGGSNTKAMLCATSDGAFCVNTFVAVENPHEATPFYEYLDRLLLGDMLIKEYLTSSKKLCIGISMPTAIMDGVPFHATKLPTITGMVARNADLLKSVPTIEANMKSYLSRLNTDFELVFSCQSDGLVAHLGAVALSRLNPCDKSVLVVCGTGFATGDERNYIMPLSVPHLGDEMLYPKAETENSQFQYAVSGKGIYAVMKRAIIERAGEPDAPGGFADAQKYFPTVRQSRLVYELWGTSRREAPLTAQMEEMRSDIGEASFAELLSLAGVIGDRAVHAIAASTVATMLYMGNPKHDGHFYIYFEGGIATNEYVLPGLHEIITMLCENKGIYSEMRKTQPPVPIMDRKPAPVRAGNCRIDAALLKQADLSIVGASAMAIAQDIISIQK